MKTILDVIQEKGQLLQGSCNGHQKCGKCKIKVLNENFPVTPLEQKILTPHEIAMGIRLACLHEYQESIKYQIWQSDMSILTKMYLRNNDNIIEDGYGLITDIGTTTVVMCWVDLKTGKIIATSAFKNPQVAYGSDVISRIEFSKKNQKQLTDILLSKIEAVLIEKADIKIKRMIVCGNTVMTNLFLNCDVSSLGHVPFKIPIKKTQIISSKQIFKNINQQFLVYTFPHIGPFVGGDIVAGVLALDIDKENNLKMLIDLGTNGEIVVGNKDGMLATSSAAGPAFEGVGITCGGPSIPGAISEVTIKDNKVTYHTIDNKAAKCICGSGLISLFASLKRNDIIDELGRFKNSKKQFNIAYNIYITQKDIQTFQLAKAAIQAGVKALLAENGNVDQIYISGGFGSHLQVKDLVELKILPPGVNVECVNNSALSGAYTLLRHQDLKRLDHIVDACKNINLAEYPDFDDYLIDGLYF